jgi:hypothetical protein
MERINRSVGFDPAPIPPKSILGELTEVLGTGATQCPIEAGLYRLA